MAETRAEAVDEKVAGGLRDSVAEAVPVTDACEEGVDDPVAEALFVTEELREADFVAEGEAVCELVDVWVSVA